MLVCDECGTEFKHNCSLRRHLLEKHQVLLGPKKRMLSCPACKSVSWNNDEFEAHLLRKHDFEVHVENKTFKTEAEFIAWKRSVEESSPVKFVIRNTQRFPEKRVVYYRCNRAGNVRKGVDGNERKREPRLHGSRKINSHCPARITASVAQNGSVEVIFCNSHFGHELEVVHVPIPFSVKERIAVQVAAKVPFEDVRLGLQGTLDGELKREHLVTSQDLRNIVRDFGLRCDSIQHADDATGIQAWVENERKLSTEDSSVLFYKQKGKVLPGYETLEDEDFMLALMTPGQRKMLLKYGKDVICIDSHGTNAYGCQMTTIFVLDEVQQAFPCAFLFTNRNDHIGLEVFLRHVKEKVGAIQARVVMSDTANVFYNCWKSVMGDCDRRLFCTWHVLRAWHDKIDAVLKNPDKKKKASDALRSLLYQTDKDAFTQMFPTLVDSLCSDAETNDFGSYIKQYYEKNGENWANCFRLNSEIDTNLEKMHDDFKQIFLNETCARRLDSPLNALMRMVNKKLFEKLSKLGQGGITLKIRVLRKRHNYSLASLDRIVPSSDENVWSVSSVSNSELYSVSRESSPCPSEPCNLLCSPCNCCVHRFSCTCIDFSVKYNLCKHIHLVSRSINEADEKIAEQEMAVDGISDANDDQFSQDSILEESDSKKEISQRVETVSTKGPSSSQLSDEDLKKEIVDTFMAALGTCQTREHLLICKRLVDSIQPAIDASVKPPISSVPKKKVIVVKSIDPLRTFTPKRKKLS